jgi:hypothetical protein
MTLQEARIAGTTRYFTGKPCKYGHIAERRVLDRGCVVCANAKAKAWKISHPEDAKKWKRTDYWSRREKYLAAASMWQKLNPAKVKIRNSAWRNRNLDKACAKEARRRAAALQQMPTWADHEAIAAVYLEAQRLREAGQDVHVDHIVPLQGRRVRGLHVHYNLQILPSRINLVKSNHFSEGMQL